MTTTNKTDQYTLETKHWLDQRFSQTDTEGVYFAHQPIYGYRAGHSEPGLSPRYIRTYQILTALGKLNFSTFLDVGGAEGYKAYLVKKFFSAAVVTSDLSETAAQRATKIFHIPADTADIHNLPYQDQQFDVVLSSETIEHVTDYKKATAELLRVAKKAVIITVPHESPEAVDSHSSDLKHAHINAFDTTSFDYLKEAGYQVYSTKMISPLLYHLLFALEANPIVLPENLKPGLLEFMPETYQEKVNNIRPLVGLYNALVPVIRLFSGPNILSFLIKCDGFLARFTPWYQATLFLILKDPTALSATTTTISPKQIMDVVVPLHFLNK